MITPRQLFWIRLKRNRKEQLRAWTSVLDWTVWLYLLIPGLFIGGGLYREAMLEMPLWAMNFPWTTLYPILLLIILFFGQIRIFVDEADRLFLLQKPEWLQSLKRHGIAYTLAAKLVVIGLPFSLLVPFLIKVEGLSWLQLVMAYSYTIVIGMILAVSIQMMNGWMRGWRKTAIDAACLLLFVAVYLIPMLAWAKNATMLGIVLSIGVIVMLLVLRVSLKFKINFEAEVKAESQARLRSTELLMSQVVESKPMIRIKRPIFFRRSQRIFRKSDAGTMLAEMRIKAFLRGMTHIRVWISFIFATTYAVTLVPGPIALFLVIALTIIGSTWLQLQWKQWFGEEFLTQFPWTDHDAQRGAVLSRFWLLLLPMLIWSSIAGYKLLGLWAVVPAAILCFVVWGFISRTAVRPVSI
ncbi:hypothetical protein BK133_23510 [Paenibacillus sp. FSL H8-0548]|uniref:ABC transporter permease n=1 Tax=Paenibacillus sp. FSL H8-0548 TaxID=1920422 RepID=UPI00096C4F26|nr:ABC transporter permease [Paenibacillus sp. FSL H8-0548]OMF23860.1 hypothetical protein BK133_23510 [Paenibacillus sp. FSL H8-0548]